MHRISTMILAGGVWLASACAGPEPLTSGPDVNLIIAGEPDLDRHPNVGALLYDFDGQGQPTRDDLLCSGTYVGPGLTPAQAPADVFLTAGHCLAWNRDATKAMWVTFDADLTNGVDAPLQVTGSIVDPGYGHDQGDLHDLALVFLPAGSVSGIAPADLPGLDLLGTMARQGGLRGVLFENVGYGGSMAFKKGPPRLSYPDKRLVSRSPFLALTASRLGLQMNPDATGQGGDCYGDSGSPKFLQGSATIVATVSWGDAVCRATSWTQRLDTPSALAFLGTYLTP